MRITICILVRYINPKAIHVFLFYQLPVVQIRTQVSETYFGDTCFGIQDRKADDDI